MRDENLHSQIVGMLDGGESYGRVLQGEAEARGAPGRIDLEGRGWSRLSGARHLVQRGPQRADIGCDDVLDQQSTSATMD